MRRASPTGPSLRTGLRLLVSAAPALLVACATGDATTESADLVLTNGKVVTVDDQLGEAEAVAVRGDRILAVGTADEIDAFVGPGTEVVDLQGRLAVPGFIEGHGHYLGLGESKMILDLTAATSWDEIVALVAEAAAEAAPGEWILGRGWHQEKWSEVPPGAVDGVPTHEGLSAVSPDNPVLLTHASGHASFANARAMQLAGLTRATPDPDGGTIVKDARGEPTGLLRETADRLVERARDEAESAMTEAEREARFRRRVELAGEEALANGVTSFQDAGTGFEAIDRLKAMADRGELPVRLYVMVRGESHEAMDARLGDYFMDGHADGFLTVRSIKQVVDGALGSHGAWLLEPYSDMPSSTGLPTQQPAEIQRTAEIAVRHGFQVNTHAIGDRGNREVLDLYQRVFEANPGADDLRWRVEHAQHLHPDDIGRFAELGVIASMQGVHCTSDAPWVLRRLGEERAESGAYMWRALWDSGATIANGTDVPVERISPIASYYATVSRMTPEGWKFYPEQSLTRMEALQTYTINNAYAAFEEDVKGSLTPGKYADITVLDRDILTVPEEEIPGTRVVMTIVGGEIRYRGGEAVTALAGGR